MKMKKLAAVIAAALVLATSAVCLTACGGNEPATNDTGVVQQQEASLAGTKWDITGMSVNGQMYSIEELEQLYGSDLEMYFSFTDTTVTSHLMGETDTTDYTYENGVVTIDGESTTVVGDSMTFSVDGETIMLKKSDTASVPAGTGTVIDTPVVETPVVAANPVANTTWDIVEVSMDGQTVTKAQLEAASGTTMDMYLEFTDSTVTYNLMGDTDTTNYTYENGSITIEGETIAVNGNTMEISMDGQSMKLQKR